MHIEVHSLAPFVDKLNEFDKIAADKEIWLTDEEISLLKQIHGKVAIITDDEDVIAAGYFVPASMIVEDFAEIDPDFQASDSDAYIYSVVVHPQHRRQGIGTRIRKALAKAAFMDGYLTGVTHIRHKRGWATAGMELYHPITGRVLMSQTSNSFDSG